jgi:hypothetical protein
VTAMATAARSRARVDVDLVDAITALLVARDEDAVVACAIERAGRLFAPVRPEVRLHPGDACSVLDLRDDADVVGPAPDGGWTVVVPLRGREGQLGDLLLHRPPDTAVHAMRAPATELGRHLALNIERVRRGGATNPRPAP